MSNLKKNSNFSPKIWGIELCRSIIDLLIIPRYLNAVSNVAMLNKIRDLATFIGLTYIVLTRFMQRPIAKEKKIM